MSRGYVVEPSKCGDMWVLHLIEDGEECGGGRFEAGTDEQGFDGGYQAALDAGESWTGEAQ